MTDYRKRLEGKLAQLAARAEIMRQFADQLTDKADPYWQTAEADATGFELEAADLRQLLAEGGRMREALRIADKTVCEADNIMAELLGEDVPAEWQRQYEKHRDALQALGDTE